MTKGSGSSGKTGSAGDARKARLSVALKANMARRKAQMKTRLADGQGKAAPGGTGPGGRTEPEPEPDQGGQQ